MKRKQRRDRGQAGAGAGAAESRAAVQGVTKDDIALRPKEARFVREYVIDSNACRAAQAAGYSANGARQRGHKLLARRRVAAAIAALRAELHARLGITAERVLEELASVAYAPRGYIDDRDKIGALALLGRHLHLFIHRHEVDMGDVQFTIAIPAASDSPGALSRGRPI